MDTLQDLPNLNFGLNVKQLDCRIHPSVPSNLLDHFLRKPIEQDLVVGTLLGTVDGHTIDIKNSFGVPFSVKDSQLIVDKEYQKKMLKFYRKAFPKEGLIGMYISSNELDDITLSAINIYHNMFVQEEKQKVLLTFPLVMMVDPKLQKDTMQVKVLNAVSTFLPKVPIFCEIEHSFMTSDYDKSGLDVLFYGQEHFDTQAIVGRQDVSHEQIQDLMQNQRLFPNKEAMLRNLTELINSLKECESYIESAKKNPTKDDTEIARKLNACFGIFGAKDLKVLEEAIKANFEDAIIVNTLAKLQMSQIGVSEKMNNLFLEHGEEAPPAK